MLSTITNLVRPWVQIHKGKVDKKVFRKNNDEKPSGPSPTVFQPPSVLVDPPQDSAAQCNHASNSSLEALSVEGFDKKLDVGLGEMCRSRSKSFSNTRTK